MTWAADRVAPALNRQGEAALETRTDYIIQNWLRNRTTIEFLGIWEQLNSPDSKPIEFDGFRKQAGLNSFVLTAKKW